MKRNLFLTVCLSISSVSNQLAADTVLQESINIAPFSSMLVSKITPPGWRPLVFGSVSAKTAYFLTYKDSKTVVQAVSHASASAYYRKIDLQAQDYPFINWEWQVDRVIDKGDVKTRQGDDYPARIYISFDYDAERLTGMERIKYKLYQLVHDEPPPLAVINYIWDNRTPTGTIVDNAYSARVKMIVVQSGATNTGKWIKQKRNIVEDYHQAFGEMPGKITGIAIMTDTDNTQESAQAWYGDILFTRK